MSFPGDRGACGGQFCICLKLGSVLAVLVHAVVLCGLFCVEFFLLIYVLCQTWMWLMCGGIYGNIGLYRSRALPWCLRKIVADKCISTKLVAAVTVETDNLLSQSSVRVSVLIEHLSYRATRSSVLLATPKKTDGSDWYYSTLLALLTQTEKPCCLLYVVPVVLVF